MKPSLVRLATALVLLALASTASADATIKRYMFSAQKAEDIRTEFGKMNMKLSQE